MPGSRSSYPNAPSVIPGLVPRLSGSAIERSRSGVRRRACMLLRQWRKIRPTAAGKSAAIPVFRRGLSDEHPPAFRFRVHVGRRLDANRRYLQPGDRRCGLQGQSGERSGCGPCGSGRPARPAGMGRNASGQARGGDVRVPEPAQQPHGRVGRNAVGRAWQDACRREGRACARHRGGGIRLRHPAAVEGRVFRRRGGRHRQLRGPPAGRRGGRHHAVQLPGHGAALDVSGVDRLR